MAKINGPKMLSGKNTHPYISPPPLSMQRASGTGLECTNDLMCTVFSTPRNLKENGTTKIRGDF